MLLEFSRQLRVGALTRLLAHILVLRNLRDKLTFLPAQLLDGHRAKRLHHGGACLKYYQALRRTGLHHEEIVGVTKELREQLLQAPFELPRYLEVLIGNFTVNVESESAREIRDDIWDTSTVAFDADDAVTKLALDNAAAFAPGPGSGWRS